MNKVYRLTEELKNNGISGVAKRLFYYFPNHCVLNKVKRAPLKYGLYQGGPRKKRIILSLTSYPPRFRNIYLCLKSLLFQSMKPDKIIVWFGNDTTESDLTEGMKDLQKYGVEYRYDKELNLKPHKKYFYAMQEFPDDIVITVDDDSVYPANTVQSLYNSYLKHPDCVSARRVHLMTYCAGKLQSYESWKKEYRRERKASHHLIAVGVGGVLYPPRIFSSEMFDASAILNTCLEADDIWLKCMEYRNGIKVVWVPCFFAHPPALGVTTSLWQSNVNEHQNDHYLQGVAQKYNVVFYNHDEG